MEVEELSSKGEGSDTEDELRGSLDCKIKLNSLAQMLLGSLLLPLAVPMTWDTGHINRRQAAAVLFHFHDSVEDVQFMVKDFCRRLRDTDVVKFLEVQMVALKAMFMERVHRRLVEMDSLEEEGHDTDDIEKSVKDGEDYVLALGRKVSQMMGVGRCKGSALGALMNFFHAGFDVALHDVHTVRFLAVLALYVRFIPPPTLTKQLHATLQEKLNKACNRMKFLEVDVCAAIINQFCAHLEGRMLPQAAARRPFVTAKRTSSPKRRVRKSLSPAAKPLAPSKKSRIRPVTRSTGEGSCQDYEEERSIDVKEVQKANSPAESGDNHWQNEAPAYEESDYTRDIREKPIGDDTVEKILESNKKSADRRAGPVFGLYLEDLMDEDDQVEIGDGVDIILERDGNTTKEGVVSGISPVLSIGKALNEGPTVKSYGRRPSLETPLFLGIGKSSPPGERNDMTGSATKEMEMITLEDQQLSLIEDEANRTSSQISQKSEDLFADLDNRPSRRRFR